MKKCPACDKTFEDSMRFCQVDGTPLVDDVPAFDPYATIVAQPRPTIEPSEKPAAEEPAAVEEPAVPAPEAEVHEAVSETPEYQTVGSLPISEPEDVLDLPNSDPLKTMYVSEDEMKAALGGTATPGEPEIIDVPPIEEPASPAPPNFSEPDLPSPSFNDIAPPPSPFSPAGSAGDVPLAAPETFEEPAGSPAFSEPPREESSFGEAATVIQPNFSSSFDTPPPAPAAEWTPPPAPDSSWQNQEIGSNTPFQPPPAGVGGQSKGLAIGALVCGVLSCLCCISVITGPAGVIMGFIAKKKADEDPAQYGGRGLALGGMITGAVGFILGIVLIILQIFFGVLSNLR